jgi:hypothetical protein
MIQRIQTLFLIIASGGFWSLFKLPFASSSIASEPFFEDKLFNLNDDPILMVLSVLGGLATLVSIFLFNKRSLQLRLGYLNIIFAIFLGVVAGWLIFSHASSIDNNAEIQDGAGLYMPVVSLLGVVAANYFIKKDDKLVKSMDRLR